jgi:hypothetical protein
MLTQEASPPPSFRERNKRRNLIPFNGCYASAFSFCQ